MSQLTIEQALQLAIAQHQAGKLPAARSIYEQILKFDPKQSDALHLLGVLDSQSGNPQSGERLIRSAIAIQPTAAHYHDSLGGALRTMGQIDPAIAEFRESIRLDPNLPGAWANLASAQVAVGQPADAIISFRKALELAPNSPHEGAMRNELAIALAQAGQDDAAISELRILIASQPNNAHAHQNLGSILSQRGQLAEAIAEFRRAISMQPQLAEAHANLGIALSKLRADAESIAAFRKATELAPHNDKNCVNLANHLLEIGEMDKAEAACRKAIQLAPMNASAHAALANVFRDSARLKESLASFDRAIELNPADPSFHSSRIFARHFYEHHDAESLYRDASEWNNRHAKPLAQTHRTFNRDRSADRPLRIGYISPDFTDHVLALLMLPLFTHHDRAQFELYFYSDVAAPGPTTDKFKQCAKKWTPIVGISDERVAAMIVEDEIDILVDLTMHMRGNRLLVFARKPAPVQITWCYPGTTGLTAIDYRITDPRLDPAGMFDSFYSEKSLRLPDTFFCYGSMTEQPLVRPAPAIANDFITFGCLNNFCKVNESVLKVWSGVLNAVNRSRLLLLSPRGKHRDWIERVLAENGIVSNRITHLDRQPRIKYLELYHQIDISLDTFPYNGHTTSLDSFWMGVPVVTMLGPSVVGRAGLSELTNLDLPNLVATSADQFVEIATNLSRDVTALEKLRAGLRPRMQASPLMDANRFARAMEAAYRDVWKNYLASAPAGSR